MLQFLKILFRENNWQFDGQSITVIWISNPLSQLTFNFFPDYLHWFRQIFYRFDQPNIFYNFKYLYLWIWMCTNVTIRPNWYPLWNIKSAMNRLFWKERRRYIYKYYFPSICWCYKYEFANHCFEKICHNDTFNIVRWVRSSWRACTIPWKIYLKFRMCFMYVSFFEYHLSQNSIIFSTLWSW